jgi:hypothetical protein
MSHDPGRGLVVGVGSGRAAATAFAERLGRPCTLLDDSARPWSMIKGAHSSVFLFLPERELDIRFASQWIAATGSSGVPTGVFPVPDDPIRAASAAARLAGLRLRARAYPRAVATYCDFVEHGPADRPSFFGRREASDFLEALEHGADMVVFQGHGNGADFRVGEHALCVQADRLRPAPGQSGERFLPCQAGGPCRLEHKSMRSFVGAERFHARAVVLISCWAFSLADGPIDPRFLFGSALLAGDHVQSVVASYRVHYNTPELSVAAHEFLAAGGDLGSLARGLNAIDEDRGSYLCFGDPDLFVRAEPEARIVRRAALDGLGEAGASVAMALSHARRLSFAADCVDRMAPSATSVTRRLRDAAAARVDGAVDFALRDLDGVVARVLAEAWQRTGITLAEAWLPSFRLRDRAPTGGTCPACAEPFVLESHESTVYRDLGRRLLVCGCHLPLADLPDPEPGATAHERATTERGAEAVTIEVDDGALAWRRRLAIDQPGSC